MNQLCIELIRGGVTLVAVCAGAFFTLKVYFRQKEYELVKQRYLDEGVDIVAAQVETYLGVLNHNYARCIRICGELKVSDENYDLKELDRGFLDLDSSQLVQIAIHRVRTLLGSAAVSDCFDGLMTSAVDTNATFTHSIPMMIRMSFETEKLGKDRIRLADQLLELATKSRHHSIRCGAFVVELHELGGLLEQGRLDLKSVVSFHGRDDVKQLVGRLKGALEVANSLPG